MRARFKEVVRSHKLTETYISAVLAFSMLSDFSFYVISCGSHFFLVARLGHLAVVWVYRGNESETFRHILCDVSCASYLEKYTSF